MAATSILLLETDPAAGEVIRTILTRAGYDVVTTLDVEGTIKAAPDHKLIIVDAVSPSTTAPTACRELRNAPTVAAMPVLCISRTDDVEERIRFLEAGADDVIARPFDARELEARLEALMLRFHRSADVAQPRVEAPEPRKRRKIVAVFSPKGGVGTTTIAVNIAAVAAQLHPGRTLLIDFDLQFGQVATHLNLPAGQSLADLVRDDEALREVELLRTYVSVPESGPHVLMAPGSPELAPLVQARHVEALLATAAEGYDAVILDAGSSLDERTLAAFEVAECVVMPVIAELAALKALHTTIEYLNEMGSTMTKAVLVLNNIFPREPLRTADVENALGAKLALDLPYDPVAYVKAVNEGVPVTAGSPRSAAAERLSRLATIALGGETAPTELAGVERRRGIGSLLRRGA